LGTVDQDLPPSLVESRKVSFPFTPPLENSEVLAEQDRADPVADL